MKIAAVVNDASTPRSNNQAARLSYESKQLQARKLSYANENSILDHPNSNFSELQHSCTEGSDSLFAQQQQAQDQVPM